MFINLILNLYNILYLLLLLSLYTLCMRVYISIYMYELYLMLFVLDMAFAYCTLPQQYGIFVSGYVCLTRVPAAANFSHLLWQLQFRCTHENRENERKRASEKKYIMIIIIIMYV